MTGPARGGGAGAGAGAGSGVWGCERGVSGTAACCGGGDPPRETIHSDASTSAAAIAIQP